MKRLIAVFAVCLLLAGSARADKIADGRYHTSASQANTITSVIRVLNRQRYTIRSADGSLGTVMANKLTRLEGDEYAAVFVTVTTDAEGGSTVEATFTRHTMTFSGGSPKDWASHFGDDLKIALPDLTASIVKR